MTKSRMFPFITMTWNPLGGYCPHMCGYCWSMGEKGLVLKYNMKKYKGKIRIIEKELKRKFNDGDFVFVQDMSDLLADEVPKKYILTVISVIMANPQATFLLLTKNPKRYFEFTFPENTVLGVTIESDINYPDISKAPPQSERVLLVQHLSDVLEDASVKLDLFISIEPIMHFTLRFIDDIKYINPWAVAVGYDNYNNSLLEPSLSKTEKLINELEKVGIKVFRKSLRKGKWENQ